MVDDWSFRQPGGLGAGSPRENANAIEEELREIRTLLRGAPVHLILFVEDDLAEARVSGVDGVVETGYDPLADGSIRLLTLQKLHGVPLAATRYPYTLAGGRFRCATPLPSNYHPPIGPPNPYPPAREGYIWPGSADFAAAFGWLREGATTALELDPTIPDYFISCVTTPIVTHVLTVGGRVVWIPQPIALHQAIVQVLIHWVPGPRLTEGLRILSAAGAEQDDPLTRSELLSFQSSSTGGREARARPEERSTPTFLDAVSFLRGVSPGKPALYMLPFDGLRALATVTGNVYEPATFPILTARLAQLPGFHGFGVARSDDPLAVSARGSTETVLRVDGRHGRIFLSGIRPRTAPYVLSWMEGDEKYRLVPMM